MLKLCVIGAQY